MKIHYEVGLWIMPEKTNPKCNTCIFSVLKGTFIMGYPHLNIYIFLDFILHLQSYPQDN